MKIGDQVRVRPKYKIMVGEIGKIVKIEHSSEFELPNWHHECNFVTVQWETTGVSAYGAPTTCLPEDHLEKISN